MTHPVRVLQIVSNIKVHSGVSSYLMGLYRNIDKEKLQFDFLVARKSSLSYEDEILSMGGKIFYMPDPLSWRVYKACQYSSDFFSIHSQDYRIVHLHSPTMASMTIKYAKLYGIPRIIIHSHSTQFSTNLLKNFLDLILVSNIEKYGTDFWCCSPEAGEFLFGKSQKVLLTPNVIEVEKFKFQRELYDKVRRSLMITDKQKLVCHVSNFSSLKNLTFLIPVIQSVTDAEPNKWKFLFIGDGKEKTRLQTLLQSKNLIQHCIFLGFQSQPRTFLAASDFFVLPSLREGFSIALLEAQACGLKCVASNTIPRFVDVTGVSFIPLDPTAWAKELLNTLPNNADERLQHNSDVSLSIFNAQSQACRQMHRYLDM